MTPVERKLAAALLAKAANHFVGARCSDFNLCKDGGLAKTEAKKVQAALARDEIYNDDEIETGPNTQDWLLMQWLAKRFRISKASTK